MKLKYYPGCLLKEYCIRIKDRHPILQGLFLIVEMDEFDAHTIALYDKDAYFKIHEHVGISHEDLNKKRRSFMWEIQAPENEGDSYEKTN